MDKSKIDHRSFKDEAEDNQRLSIVLCISIRREFNSMETIEHKNKNKCS